MYLEIMTGPEAAFDDRAIRGPLTELARLASLIETSLAAALPGSLIEIRDEFACDGPAPLFSICEETDLIPPTLILFCHPMKPGNRYFVHDGCLAATSIP